MNFLFDIGQTNIRLATSSRPNKIDEVLQLKTPSVYKDAVFAIAEITKALLKNQKIQAAAGGIAGPLDKTKSKLLGSIQKGWINKPLKKDLEKILKCSVHLENDAAMAGIGEAVFGAGKNHNIIGYLTISTGVGGARIVNQELDVNSFGFEPNKQIIDKVDGKIRHIEHFISGHAISRSYGMPAEKLNDKKAWQRIEEHIAVGLLNSAVFWSPDLLVVGGPVFFNENISVDRINKFLSKNLEPLPKIPKVVKAKLKNLSGLYGALAIANKKNRP
jgi:predicted NBD/HSP70 family sugar kinase